ncbi:hypothetical protein NF867_03520 [Solitalea sp. MAHUQ-68]|uniref:Uncharacterized protein n=1 Tax=Solitalea agri TaxID=2953739 RepID=A0A9X2F750_9SPHI|nr:hypothetical protein [Solitalea agri]MCO4291928.1 hypothetical protein [Solitalea agri]
MSKYLFLGLFFISSTILQCPAQTLEDARKDLNKLLEQRSSLFQEWKRNNEERNAFFGGQSKNDLKQVIATQQRIIEMDNRIMDAIDRLNIVKNSSVIEKKDSLSNQTFRFNSEQMRLQNIIKQRESRIAVLKEDIRYHEKTENTLKGAFVISLAALIGLGLWIWSKR